MIERWPLLQKVDPSQIRAVIVHVATSHKRKLSWELLCLVCLKLNSLSDSYWGQNMHANRICLKAQIGSKCYSQLSFFLINPVLDNYAATTFHDGIKVFLCLSPCGVFQGLLGHWPPRIVRVCWLRTRSDRSWMQICKPPRGKNLEILNLVAQVTQFLW